MKLHPFRALRVAGDSAQAVASVPYDVVDVAEARALASGNPLSFLHVVRSEIDLPDGTDPYDEQVYARAAENLRALRDQKHLVETDTPSLFAYRMAMGSHVQLGVLACCRLDDYESGVIKKHELTRPDKEDDRTRHIVATRAQCGPVLVTYRDHPPVDDLLARLAARDPELTCRSETGVAHDIWRIDDPESVVRAFAQVPHAYIADGHHRSASAARARAELRGHNPEHNGSEEYNYFLVALFPASQMKILAYNRVITDLGGHTASQVLDQAARTFVVEEARSPVPERALEFCAYLAGTWYRLALKPEHIHASDPVRSLDCSALQEHFLQPILGIRDIRTDPRVSFVGGIRGTEILEQRVDAAGDGIAFSMYPTSIEQLFAVADAGQIMPPKSTWFEPKLRSGLVMHLI